MPAAGPEPQGLCTRAWPQARWRSRAAAGASGEGRGCRGLWGGSTCVPQESPPPGTLVTLQVTGTEGLCLCRLHPTYPHASQGLPQLRGEPHLSLVLCYSVPRKRRFPPGMFSVSTTPPLPSKLTFTPEAADAGTPLSCDHFSLQPPAHRPQPHPGTLRQSDSTMTSFTVFSLVMSMPCPIPPLENCLPLPLAFQHLWPTVPGARPAPQGEYAPCPALLMPTDHGLPCCCPG